MRKLLASVLLCSAVLACDTRSGAGITIPFTAETGTYTLKSISDRPMPVTLQPTSPNATRQLIADTLVLQNGGNIREVFYIRTITTTVPRDTSVASTTNAGKYTITRDSITVPTDFGYKFGRYSNGTIAMTDTDGFVYLFTKP